LDETSKPSTQLDLLDKLTSWCALGQGGHVLVAGALLLSAALSLVLALVI